MRRSRRPAKGQMRRGLSLGISTRRLPTQMLEFKPKVGEQSRGRVLICGFHMADAVTVSDIFRRALELRQADPNADLKEVKRQIVSEFGGGTFPNTAFLTIPEY